MKIKNNTGSSGVWAGQTIAAAAYYTIQTIELFKWQNNSTVLSDLGAGNLIMNDETADIIDVATGINYLFEIKPLSKEIFRKYANISALSNQDHDYTPANGKILTITELGANAVQKPTTKVCIIWDPGGAQEEILLTTVGDTAQHTNRSFSGNGTRKLRIQLDNQDAVTQTMGGYVLGSEV
jgi:hypothetical protein